MSKQEKSDYLVIASSHEDCEACHYLSEKASFEAAVTGAVQTVRNLEGRDETGDLVVLHEVTVVLREVYEDYLAATLKKIREGLLRGIQNCV